MGPGLSLKLLDRALLILAILQAALVVWFFPGPFGADAHAVYLPIARALNEGAGLHGFAPLAQGELRLPGHPSLLAAAAGLTGDLRAATELLNVLALSGTGLLVHLGVRQAGAAEPWPGLAALLALLEPNLVLAGGKALPDAVAVGLICAVVACLLAERRRTGWRAAGWVALAAVIAALAMQVRLNLVALLPAGLVFLFAQRRPGRWLRTPLFLLVWALPLLLLLPLARALAEIEIGFPHGSIERGIVAGQRGLSGSPGWPQMLSAAWHGVLDLPTRLLASVSAPWVALGVVALPAGLWRRPRDPTRLIAFLVFFGMAAALVPIHFEARYYTFAAPLLVGASAVTLDGLLRGPWGRVLVPVVGALTIAQLSSQVAELRGPLAERRRTELAARELCAFLDRERGDEPSLMVAATDRLRLYSRFNDCETSVRRPQRIFLAADVHLLSPLPFRIWEGASPAPNKALVAAEELRFGPWRVQRVAPEEPSSSSALGPPSTAPPVRSLDWTRALPWNAAKACRSEWLEAPSGRYRLVAELHSSGDVAARLGVDLGSQRLMLYGALGTRHERVVEIPRGARIRIGLCPLTAYKSGQLRVGLSLHPLEEPHPAPAP